MNQSDRDIETWDQRLVQQTVKGWDNYLRRRIHLDAARIMELWPITGEFLYVEKTSSKSASATIRLEKTICDPIDLQAGVKLRTVFRQLYLTHVAQAGEWIDVIIGINFDYENPIGDILAEEAQPIISQVLTLANTNYQIAANPCNGVIMRGHYNNVAAVGVNMGANPTATDAWWLGPTHALALPCSNTNRIYCRSGTAGQRLQVFYIV